MWKHIKTYNPIQNPFRMIHEVYVWRVWFKAYREQRPELKDAWDRKNANLNALVAQFYFILLGLLIYLIVTILAAEKVLENRGIVT